MFPAEDELGTMSKIIKVLGSEPFEEFVARRQLSLPETLKFGLPRGARRVPWAELVHPQDESLYTPAIGDLLDKMLKFDFVSE